MTEQTVATDEGTATREHTEATTPTEQQLPPMEEQDWFDPAAGILFAKYVELNDTVNSEVAWLKENSSDLLTVIEAIENDENDSTASAAQTKIEQLKNEQLKVEEALRKYSTEKAKARIEESQDSDAVKQHEAAHAAAKVALRDYSKTFRSNYKDPNDDSKSVFDPYLPATKNLGRQSSSGTGGRRLRDFKLWTVDGKNVETTVKGEKKSTASGVAKHLGVDVTKVQEAYWSAAGTRDPKDFPDHLEFEMTVGDERHKITADYVGNQK